MRNLARRTGSHLAYRRKEQCAGLGQHVQWPGRKLKAFARTRLGATASRFKAGPRNPQEKT